MRRLLIAAALFLLLSSVSTAQLPFQTQVFVIPVVVSSPGQNGSFFRTALQAYNGSASPIMGTFVFRPQGAPSSLPNPTLVYTINSGETVFYADLLAAMGQSGIGSVDVTAATGAAAPILAVRVFNDGGDAGTNGFTENAKKVTDLLSTGSTAVLVAPSDTQAFRFNIGVRTFTVGASIDIAVRDRSGAVRKTFSATYGPSFFEQIDARSFLGGLSLQANDTITISVRAGRVILYGTSADNKTNDAAFQDPQPILMTQAGTIF